MTQMKSTGEIVTYISTKIFTEAKKELTPEEFKETYELILRDVIVKDMIDFTYLEFDLATLNSISNLAKFKLQVRERMEQLNLPADDFSYYFIDAVLFVTSSNYMTEIKQNESI